MKDDPNHRAIHDLIDYAERQTERAEKVGGRHGQPGAGDASAVAHSDEIPGYQLLRRIDRGGQADVYEAIKLSTRKRVALKVLWSLEPTSEKRLRREIRVLGALNHPNIVRIIDGGTVGGRWYVAMDLIEGRPLDKYIESVSPPIADIVSLFIKICDAVKTAHVKGVIHRDLKPKNILVDAAGEPHILDFGLAKLIEGDAWEGSRWSEISQSGQFLGSLCWSAPEQVEAASDQIDTRTDVYALGVLLYHALTGQFPYDVAGLPLRMIQQQIVDCDPVKPRTIRPDLDLGWSRLCFAA
jgi:eukaryotic-like serine/threonine-protein kinase